MPHENFTSIVLSRTCEEFRKEIQRFASRLGFEMFNALVVVDHIGRESDFLGVNSNPPEALVLDGPEIARRDPVMQHCKHSKFPIVWDRDTYASVGMESRWEEQARFGFHAGMALALHLPEKKHFFLAVDRDRPLPNDSLEVARMTADLSLFTIYAQEAAMRLLLPPAPEMEVQRLTLRELESLKWTMEGKTAWEVGQILSISEQTAVRHLTNAARKLDCINKHQAVVKAIRLGLIW